MSGRVLSSVVAGREKTLKIKSPRFGGGFSLCCEAFQRRGRKGKRKPRGGRRTKPERRMNRDSCSSGIRRVHLGASELQEWLALCAEHSSVAEPLRTFGWLAFAQVQPHSSPLAFKAMKVVLRTIHQEQLQRWTSFTGLFRRDPNCGVDCSTSCNLQHRTVRVRRRGRELLVPITQKNHLLRKAADTHGIHDMGGVLAIGRIVGSCFA